MDTDIRALLAIAQAYFDAAYDMDADKFASVFHHSCLKVNGTWKIVQKVMTAETR
jgi:hypothetical protein